MLILVAVTVRTVIQSGLFGHAGKATSGYSMHEAREQLGTTLAGAMAEKYTNKDYNEDDYLDEYIKDNLPGSQIAGDVVLVDGWAFELDRTVPEIVNDLGKGNPEDFKSPELTVTKGTLAEDKLSIPLNITALEATNGISKIEVYKVGEKDPIETFTCSNEKTQVAKTFTVTENTKYKIVAYSKLRATKTIEVTEISGKPKVTVTKGTLAEDKLSIPLTITAIEERNGISKIEIYKTGKTEPVQIYTYSDQKDEITETYLATENATYTIKAYSKEIEEKEIEVFEFPAKIGDYVRYTPDAAENYTKITAATGGYKSNQYIAQDTTLKWKVLSLNDDGTIDLIADKPISRTVYFQGALGYNNGVYLLDDLCKLQYSNASLGAIGRSIDLVDIEKHFNDDGRAARDTYTTSTGIQYGDTRTYSGNSDTPNIYKNNDKNVTNTPNNIAQLESELYYSTVTIETSTQESSLTFTHTMYALPSQASYYNDPNFHNLIFGTGKTYWLASRYAVCNSTYVAFGLRCVNVSDFAGYMLFESDSNVRYNHCAIRPVVSLGSNYKLQYVSGTNEFEIVRK